jgi:hypothetical protein
MFDSTNIAKQQKPPWHPHKMSRNYAPILLIAEENSAAGFFRSSAEVKLVCQSEGVLQSDGRLSQ